MQKLDVLFFGTHPDDVELTCGGTVYKLAKYDKKVGIVDLTQGELSTRGNLASRKKETDAASKVLGISVRENLKLRDGNITNDETSRKKIISVLRKYQPQVVFAPYPFDRHPDHINAGNLIKDSIFYSGLVKIKTGNYKPWKKMKTYFYPQHNDIPMSFIIDISEEFKKKIDSVLCYQTQFFSGKDSHQEETQTYISSEIFYKNIEAKARYFGFKIGVEYGEPYFSYDTLKFDIEQLF
jgi:bacillithiol biosynthesis deacetylase BshB1